MYYQQHSSLPYILSCNEFWIYLRCNDSWIILLDRVLQIQYIEPPSYPSLFFLHFKKSNFVYCGLDLGVALNVILSFIPLVVQLYYYCTTTKRVFVSGFPWWSYKMTFLQIRYFEKRVHFMGCISGTYDYICDVQIGLVLQEKFMVESLFSFKWSFSKKRLDQKIIFQKNPWSMYKFMS